MKRALVIEDNEDNYVLISDLLRHAGYTPLKASTGKTGIARALNDDPDFILLDIQLPDIDGYEVVKRIMDAKDSPIIVISSYATSQARRALLSAGCVGYIEKPIDPLHVIGQIQACLGKSA